MRPAAPVSTSELVLILVLTLAATGLRWCHPEHLAVEHFDEGVYASNLYCPGMGNIYPFQHLYAPPLLPTLLEFALILSGGHTASVMWVNLMAGSVIVPSVWWIGRNWFGPRTGLVAAGIACVSAIQIQYSRAALTDGLLCLWMLWGVYWAWKAILTGRAVAVLLAGAFASLAWWTKYNGWLTLAISGAGTAAWLVSPRVFSTPCDSRRVSAISRWLAVAVIAIVGWSPVPVGLQDVGGYSAVSSNHAQYFVGITGWSTSLARQAEVLLHYHGGLNILAVICVTVAICRLGPRDLPPNAREERIRDGRALAGWMLAAWSIGLLVAVPLYTPYPRLVLPWVISMWMVYGLVVSWFSGRVSQMVGIADGRVGQAVAMALLCGALLIQGAANGHMGVTSDRRGLKVIASQILEGLTDAEPGSGRAIALSVLGEPGLFFHLAAMAASRPEIAVVPAGAYPSAASIAPDVSMYVVTGPHAPPHNELPAEVRGRFVLHGEWAYHPSDLVLLDKHGPAALATRDARPTESVHVYRMVP